MSEKYTFVLVVSVCFFLLLSCREETPVSPGNDNGNGNSQITADVKVWLTNANRLMLNSRQNDIAFSDQGADIVIEVDASRRYQEIVGFGAAMTGSSAFLIAQRSAEERRAILTELFDAEEGIGITNIRLTIGSSDFSLGTYSYCDDPGIENFAIPDVDLRDVIPVMQQALEVNPDLWIMASPWSAPAWMKDNGSMHGGRLLEGHFDDFARYLKRFIQAYESHGIPIHAITVQNEPLHETGGYPTMFMPWEDQNRFIRDYLGPLFEAENISTDIIIYDHNWDRYDYPIRILDDELTRQYVIGSAFHGYGGDVGQMSNVSEAHPDKDLFFTEISGGGWATDFWQNIVWNMDHIFLGTVRNGSRNAIFWNLALDEQDGPKNGGCQNCRGVVTLPTGISMTRNEEYYVLAHMARHVRPGDVRLFTTPPQEQLNYLSFMSDSGDFKMVILNRAELARTFQVTSEKGNFRYVIPGRTLGTFVW